MGILTGFQKIIDRIPVSEGWQTLSRWTSSQSVEYDDGKTAEIKNGAIDGITDSLTATNSNIALSASAGSSLQNQVTNIISDLDTKIGTMRRLTDTDNLDAIQDAGVYYWYSTIPTNAPFTGATILEVLNISAYRVQRATQIGTPQIAIRCMYYNGENVTGWRTVVNSTELDTFISDLQGKVLWTISTSALSTEFAAQTITLNETINNYNYYEIEYALSSDTSDFRSTRFKTGKIPKSGFARMVYSGQRNYYRTTSVPNGTSLTINNSSYFSTYNSSETKVENSYLIPVCVIAYKYL